MKYGDKVRLLEDQEYWYFPGLMKIKAGAVGTITHDDPTDGDFVTVDFGGDDNVFVVARKYIEVIDTAAPSVRR